MRYLLILISFITLIYSCKKDKELEPPAIVSDNAISYPDSVYYGKNILTMVDSVMLDSEKVYGFGAILGNDASLKIKVSRLVSRIPGEVPPTWGFIENPSFWIMQSDASNGWDSVQTFTAIAKGKIDLEMYFYRYGQNGKAKLEFYENSNSITKTKYIKW